MFESIAEAKKTTNLPPILSDPSRWTFENGSERIGLTVGLPFRFPLELQNQES